MCGFKAGVVLGLSVFFSALAAQAEVKVCLAKTIETDQLGRETVKNCTWKVDSKDGSKKIAPGSIKRDPSLYLGTAKNDCGMLPKAYGLYDQGEQSGSDTQATLEYLLARYRRHGLITLDPAQIASSRWYAGGEGALVTSVYEYFDKDRKSLGLMLLAPGNPRLQFEGCFKF